MATSSNADGAGVYREGLAALLDAYRARRLRVAERARGLDTGARAALLPAHRREIEAAEARLVEAPSTRDELEAAESALDAYEGQLDVALAVVAELGARRAADAEGRRRSRRSAVVATAIMSAMAAGLWAAERIEHHREIEHLQRERFADCRGDPECAARGLCSPPPPDKRGDSLDCFADSDADCAASRACARDGACVAFDGVCRPGTWADCARSELCAQEGTCGVDGGACRALTDADCAGSRVCAHAGRCAAREGICVVSDAGCRAAPSCGMNGSCSAVDGECAARSSDDCAHSQRCRQYGECARAASFARCVVSEAGCRASEGCRHSGYCGSDGSACVLTSAADCRESDLCKEDGYCGREMSFVQCSATAEGCRASARCRRTGLCVLEAGGCMATADDCRASTECKEHGVCGIGGDGLCHAARE